MVKLDTGGPFKKGEKIVATTDLRGVPEGTPGKVAIVNGLTWIRYWVRFDNGVALGQVDGPEIVRRGEWTEYQARRADAAENATKAAEQEAARAAAKASEGAAVEADTKPKIPAHLLERAKKAKAKKAAS